MSEAILGVNAGSATLKYALYSRSLECILRGQADGADHHAMLGEAFAQIAAAESRWNVVAAGHRVVHGADRYTQPCLVDESTLAFLDSLCPLAPLHQPHNLAAIRAVMALRPALAQVACFDTAFHQSQPEIARRFALPRALHDAGVKRYGFHGLSYEYVARQLPKVLGSKAGGKVIVAHLGNGASLCAIENGRSVATSMGFTALDGLVMGTRAGALDPGVLLYLMDAKGLSVHDLERLLYRESGLLGVSGISHDMRALLASDDPHAKSAIDLFVYRAAREIGSLAAALGGLDALVFTAGIGEHAAPVRAAISTASRWLGVEIDAGANTVHATRIESVSSKVMVAVIATNEEEMIARHVVETASGHFSRT